MSDLINNASGVLNIALFGGIAFGAYTLYTYLRDSGILGAVKGAADVVGKSFGIVGDVAGAVARGGEAVVKGTAQFIEHPVETTKEVSRPVVKMNPVGIGGEGLVGGAIKWAAGFVDDMASAVTGNVQNLSPGYTGKDVGVKPPAPATNLVLTEDNHVVRTVVNVVDRTPLSAEQTYLSGKWRRAHPEYVKGDKIDFTTGEVIGKTHVNVEGDLSSASAQKFSNVMS
jgi:hypothetical protein